MPAVSVSKRCGAGGRLPARVGRNQGSRLRSPATACEYTPMTALPSAHRARDWTSILDVCIDPTASDPLFRQIYTGFRDLITSGTLPAGTRLPATRRLAELLALSRTSAVAAYDQLLT